MLTPGLVWFAVSQFVLAGGLTLFLTMHFFLINNYGSKYVHFDETGVEFKTRYFSNKTFLHWEHIARILFERRRVTVQLKDEEQRQLVIKCPYDKYDEIKEDFIQYVEPKNIVIEQR